MATNTPEQSPNKAVKDAIRVAWLVSRSGIERCQQRIREGKKLAPGLDSIVESAVARDDSSIEVGLTIQAARVSKRDVSYLLASAFEQCSGFWCRILGYRDPKEPKAFMPGTEIFPYADFPLTPDGAVICYEQLDDVIAVIADQDARDAFVKRNRKHQRVLDISAIERGLALLHDKHPKVWARFVDENADAHDADVFLQLALLGEVRYA